MAGYIYGRLTSPEELPVLLSQMPAAWCYLENEQRVDLLYAHEMNDPVVFRHGRLFGEAYEIRWTWIDNHFSVQILTEQALSLPGFEVAQCTVSPPFLIYLWGLHHHYLTEGHFLRDVAPERNLWIETRIPRPLVYPVDSDQPRVVVSARHYLRDGLICTTRWLSLKGHSDV